MCQLWKKDRKLFISSKIYFGSNRSSLFLWKKIECVKSKSCHLDITVSQFSHIIKNAAFAANPGFLQEYSNIQNNIFCDNGSEFPSFHGLPQWARGGSNSIHNVEHKGAPPFHRLLMLHNQSSCFQPANHAEGLDGWIFLALIEEILEIMLKDRSYHWFFWIRFNKKLNSYFWYYKSR